MRLKKRPNGSLPPLESGGTSSSRTHSAPEGAARPKNEEAEGAVMLALQKARSNHDKDKRLSSTEKNLFNSPFAQPLLAKAITDGSKPPSP